MSSLRDQIANDTKRAAVIDDACDVLEREVSDKSGLSGMAVKAGYKLVKGFRPGFIREAVDHLLNDFLDALDPIYHEAVAGGHSPKDHFSSNGSRVADALLAVTDKRAENAKHGAIKKAYEKLRGVAKKHVEAAVPRLGDMVARHTGG